MIKFRIRPSDVVSGGREGLLETRTCFFMHHPDAGRMANDPNREDAPPAGNGELAPCPLPYIQTGTFRVFEELFYEKPLGAPASPAVLR